MFDNLRDLSDSESPFYEEEQNDLYKEATAPSSYSSPAPARRRNRKFLGMTAQQRFIITFMLMFTVCILGTLAMFITGRMSLF